MAAAEVGEPEAAAGPWAGAGRVRGGEVGGEHARLEKPMSVRQAVRSFWPRSILEDLSMMLLHRREPCATWLSCKKHRAELTDDMTYDDSTAHTTSRC